MPNLPEIPTASILLASVRISMVVALLPFLSNQMVPPLVRRAIGLVLILVVFPPVHEAVQQAQPGWALVIGLLAKEAFLGLLLGFVAALPFWLAVSMGALVDMQRGAFSGAQFSPFVGSQTSLLGLFFSLVFTVIFLARGGFLMLIDGLYQSYTVWPVLEFVPPIETAAYHYFVSRFAELLLWTLVLAGPMVIACFLIDLAMGLLNRFVPQLPVFFLSLPLKSAATLFILSLYVFNLSDFMQGQFQDIPNRFIELRGLFR